MTVSRLSPFLIAQAAPGAIGQLDLWTRPYRTW